MPIASSTTAAPGRAGPARPVARVAALVLAVVLAASACSGGDSGDRAEGVPTAIGRPPSGPPVPPPTLAGGLDLEAVDPAVALVGHDLAYGAPLPSVTAALAAFRDGGEVGDALVRDARLASTAAVLARVTLLSLLGEAFFDEVALDGYVDGLLAASLPGSTAVEPAVTEIAGTEVRRVAGEAGGGGEAGMAGAGDDVVVATWRRGDLLVLVEGPAEGVDLVLARSLEAVAEGAVGQVEPHTPLPPPDGASPLVEVPAVEFVPFPPPEEEQLPDPPQPPELPGGMVVDGRIGVVAGERRTTVWVIATDPQAIPTVEVLDPLVAGLLAARTGGGAARPVEVLGSVVAAADGGEDAGSARAFRHGRTVVLVEGADPAQLDAVVSAWLAVLPAAP